MLRSTFLGYKTASSALKVNQNALDVVGQNISNVNTNGYTRQSLDINSVSFSSSNIKFSMGGVIIGQGVGADSITQYRDGFLDLRYRAESAKVGSENIQLEALNDLEYVFDEISTEGLDAQFLDLIEQLQSLTSSPSDPVIEGVVRTSASMLCQMFNDYSEQINTIENQQLTYLKDGAIEKTNQLLENISVINKQIKENNISGNDALELNDERNMLIDELSSYLNIEVVKNPIAVGGGRSVDLLSVNLIGPNGVRIKIVNDEKFAELAVSNKTSTNDQTGIVLNKSIDMTTDADGNPLYADGKDLTGLIDKGQLGGYLNFLNGKGDFAVGTENTSKGILYYENMLNTLANKFAEVMNEANKFLSVDANKKPLMADGITIATDPKDYVYKDKPLFESRDGGQISAENIKISDAWSDASSSYITNTKKPNISGDNSGATDNILKMISLFQSGSGTLDFKANGNTIFKGTMQEFFSFTSTRLSLEIEDVKNSYDTYSQTQYEIDYQRSSMSSVDLDEEGISLLTFQKAYNAAAKLMTTLDEMLDTLINRMGA